MKALDFPPAKHEVVDQMKRMLASARFRAAGNPSAFFELAVKRALSGKKTTGLIVAKEIFGGTYNQTEQDDVRVTAHSLRKLLARYNENEGAHDVVTISFPEPRKDATIRPVAGEAYTPQFSYNPKHPAHISLRLGFRFLQQGMYRDYDHAYNLFAGALEEDAENLGAALGLVETLCKFADRHWDNPVHVHPFIASERLFEKFQGRGDNYWRFWATRAYLYQGRGEANNDKARTFYAEALKRDRMATEGFLPYIDFLLLVNQTEEALGLAQRYVNERVEDGTAIVQYGMVLIATGRYDPGIGHLRAALSLDPHNCLAHEALATIFLIRGNLTEASFHLRTLKTLCDPESFECVKKYLNRNRGQVKFKDNIEKLLLESSSAASSAIVKQ
jgi:tetratricopeptide (TPR) repeat protein